MPLVVSIGISSRAVYTSILNPVGERSETQSVFLSSNWEVPYAEGTDASLLSLASLCPSLSREDKEEDP